MRQQTSRKYLGLVIIAIITAGSGLTHAVGQESKQRQPNILFLFADDHSFDSVHQTGNQQVKTPNIDSIARSGVTFERAYNMGAWGGAVCVASRTMLNTGRFVWHAQRLNLKAEQAEGRTWAQRMHAAGYETYFTGKWHVSLKPQSVFDHVGQVRAGMPKTTPEAYNRPLADRDDPWQPWDRERGGFWEGGKHWSEVVADDAISFLNQAKGQDRPFFMYVAFNAPHDPRQSPREFVQQYPADQIKVPDNYLSEYPYKDKIGCSPQLRDERLAPFPRTEHAVQVHRQEYYAIITHMDREIGRILDALQQSGLADQTVVFFTADHGLACGHHGLMGKQNMYEHSMRVPFFVQGPGIPQGKSIGARIYLQDAMATAIDLGGGEQQGIDFKSLLPLIAGQRDRQYEAIYGGYTQLQRMVVEGDWKLILYPEAQRLRLFNLADDPLEMHDLAEEADQQARIESMLSTFQQLQQQTGDDLSLPWSAQKK